LKQWERGRPARLALFLCGRDARAPLFGIQGYAGKREGVTGSFKLNYRF
jgi:hypothetical protein